MVLLFIFDLSVENLVIRRVGLILKRMNEKNLYLSFFLTGEDMWISVGRIGHTLC